LTGAAKIEPLIDVEVAGAVLSLELLQAASVAIEHAIRVFRVRVLMFKVIHHLE
jgi:hypothetical protein